MKGVPILAGVLAIAAIAGGRVVAQTDKSPWSERAAHAAMGRWPDGRFAPAGARWGWNYELGALLVGAEPKFGNLFTALLPVSET
jgi:hypothetical protein